MARACLSMADLRWARLREADLTDVDLVGARLEGVEMWKTKLAGARITRDSLHAVEAHLSAAQLAALVSYGT